MQIYPDTDRQTPPTVLSLNDQMCKNTTIKLTCCSVYSHSAAAIRPQVWPCCFCIQAFFKEFVCAAFNISNQCTTVSVLELACETMYVVCISWWKAWTEVHFFFFAVLCASCVALVWACERKWNISIHYAVCEHCGSQIKDFRWEDGSKSMPRRDMKHQTQIWRNKKNLEHWWEAGELEKIFIIRHQTRVSFIIQKRVCTCQTADHVCASHYIQ